VALTSGDRRSDVIPTGRCGWCTDLRSGVRVELLVLRHEVAVLRRATRDRGSSGRTERCSPRSWGCCLDLSSTGARTAELITYCLSAAQLDL